MFKNLFILAFCMFSIASNANKTLQNKRFIVFDKGSCWDANTGVDLKSRVYSVIDDIKIKIGESNSEGLILNLNIPTNSQFLVFESDGYEPIRKQTYFIGSFSGVAKFNMSLPMLKKGTIVNSMDSKQKFNRTPETAIFCIPENRNQAIDYELLHSKNRTYCTNFTNLIVVGSSFNIDLSPNHYLLVMKSKNGQIKFEKELVIVDGLSFIDLHIEDQVKVTKVDEKPATLFDTRTLYFDQSSYELKANVKTTLDSVVTYLTNHSKVNITVFGYTDNVGSKKLNVALSEFRARTVAGYLKKKGVLSSQIITQGKGPDSLVILKNSEEINIKSRRVVIQIQ